MAGKKPHLHRILHIIIHHLGAQGRESSYQQYCFLPRVNSGEQILHRVDSLARLEQASMLAAAFFRLAYCRGLTRPQWRSAL